VVKPNLMPKTHRYTCVSLLLADGAPPHVVQQIVGHSAIDVTMSIYAHASLDDGCESTALSQLTRRVVLFAKNVSGVPQRLRDVLRFQVRQVGDDFLSGHAVGDHGHDRGDGDPEAANGRNPSHHVGVNRDPRELHAGRLALAGRLWNARASGARSAAG